MVIYVDILIIINTLVNYFILLGIRKLSRSYTKRWRVALGALVGGISSLLIFLENLGVIMTALKFVTAVLMIFVTFGLKPIKQTLKRLLYLFAITFLFGGFTFAIYILFDKDLLLYSNGIIYFDVDMTFLVVCAVVSYVIISIVSRLTDKKAPVNKEYYITIQNNGKTVSCKALMDTGNNLREPFSGYPVIMAEKVIFNRLMCNEKQRLIPVSTVNGETLVSAFRPEKITIGKYSTDKVYIGESTVETGEYKIILNINLEGEMQNEN